MRIQIRSNIFETNSSSTHTLVLCSEETFEEWKQKKLVFDIEHDEFVSTTDIPASYKIPEEMKKHIEYLYREKCKESPFLVEWEDVPEEAKETLCMRYWRMVSARPVNPYYSFEEYMNCGEGSYSCTRITPLGETVVGFGYYDTLNG